MSAPVARTQRFTRDHPCPICGGWDTQRRGQGQRCWGYVLADGTAAVCMRTQSDHELEGGWLHRLGDRAHQNGSEPAELRRVRYDIRDSTSGKVVATHVRVEFTDTTKRIWWQGGLGGRPVTSLPLYMAHRVKNDVPKGATIIVCEGEPACDALWSIGQPAVGTVTGAGTTLDQDGHCPDAEVFAELADYTLVLWPDNDQQGRWHMAAASGRIGPGTRVIRWTDASEKGDAADFVKAGGTLEQVRQLVDEAAFSGQANGVESVDSAIMDWPEPARIDGPPSAPRLPLECFPEVLLEHAQDVAERMQCPIDYVVWTLMVTLSTVIGRAVGLRPKRLDDWTERPALWVALIGDPSSMKTPGQNAGVRLLYVLSRLLREQHQARLKQWKADCAAAKMADRKAELEPEPELQWLVADDATTEKLAMLLQPEISRGLVLIRDEVSGLIRELERYRARAGDREFLIQAYSGGPKSVARMSRPPVFVPDLLLNIVGGIQPDVAREVFASGADDGLGERFLAIWPEQASTFVDIDRFPDKDKRDAFDEVAKRLYVADWPQLLTTDDFSHVPYCRVSQEAHRVFSEWRARTVQSTRGEDARYTHRFGRRVGKYPGVAARLSLVLHLFEAVALGDVHQVKAHLAVVESAVVARVVRLMDEYVLPMEQRVYEAYAVAPEAEGARRIARWIRAERPDKFTAREIRRHEWSDLDSPTTVAAALEWLCSRGWLREAEPAHRMGRPSDVFLVNPKVLA